jgi:hypothetical protein
MALDVKQAQEVQQVTLPVARTVLTGLEIESEYRPALEVGGKTTSALSLLPALPSWDPPRLRPRTFAKMEGPAIPLASPLNSFPVVNFLISSGPELDHCTVSAATPETPLNAAVTFVWPLLALVAVPA